MLIRLGFLFLALSSAAFGQRVLTLGMVAKSQGNPFFEAARAGAEAAARELGTQHGVSVRIDWRTPIEEDAQRQAEYIEQLVLAGADGLIVSCSDANKLTGAIDRAVGQGVPVVTFSGDAPASRRMVSIGIDDFACGERTFEELARLLQGRGVVAAIDGNPNAVNLQQRAAGFRAAAARHPGIRLVDIFYHKETPADAVARIEQVMQAHPDITGWGFLGGWPLFTDRALKWPPGAIQCVSVDALPPQLVYVRSGHVQLLLAQDVYAYGQLAVRRLVEKLHLRRDPPAVIENTALLPVDATNVEAYAKNWETWLPK